MLSSFLLGCFSFFVEASLYMSLPHHIMQRPHEIRPIRGLEWILREAKDWGMFLALPFFEHSELRLVLGALDSLF